MGDNQLSILIQAKINESSVDTMQNQLTQLASKLKAVKISLDLGDVKAQFAKMFQEIEKETQKQKIKSGAIVKNAGNQSFTGSYDEALKKAVVHANALDKHMDRVKETVKGLGNIKNLSEEFSSADGSLLKMKAQVEQVDGTLKQIKNVEVFRTLNKETGEFEYELGRVLIQTKQFGHTLDELQNAGKGSPYEALYNAMKQFADGGKNATKVANDLHNAIYTQKGEERAFFQKLDLSIQEEYLNALKQARAEEIEMDKTHYQALQMNKKIDNANMDALHKEALSINKAYDNQKKADAKTSEAIDKAHYQALQMNKAYDIAKMDALHKEALAMNKNYDNKRKAQEKEAYDMDKAHYQALQMNKAYDIAQMDAVYSEALALNKAYDKRKQDEYKKSEAIDKAHYQALQIEAQRNTAKMDAIHKEALAENERRNKEALALDKAHAEALKMNKQKDIKEQTQQANVDLFKKQMTKDINSLLGTHKVDTTRIDALKTSMEQLDGKTQNASNVMKKLRAEFKELANDSIQVTNVTNNMGKLEAGIVTITEQFKTGQISVQKYAETLEKIIKNKDGSVKADFRNKIDINSQEKYLKMLESAQAQERKHNEEIQNKKTFYADVEAQVKKLNDAVKDGSKHDTAQFDKLISEYNELRDAVKNGNMSLTEAKSKYRELGIQLRAFQQETAMANASSGKFFKTLKMMVGIYSLFDVFNLGKRVVKSMVEEVKTLDASLVEMNKVAGLSVTQLNGFVDKAYSVANSVGRLGSDVINATGDFVKMGESVNDAIKLAENALLYVNVGDNVSVDDATSTMVSTMKAFNIQADNSIQIVDKLNNMANNFAITTAGLGDGLQIAASSLASANNTIDETLALMSVGNQVTQDPNVVSAGLRTISMRLRGLKDDSGELVSNMEQIFEEYANGIKIINEDGSFKSTFEILNELGKIWSTLTDQKQAFLAEKISGKNRANIFLSLMQNAEDLEKALETSQNSFNSAIMENERFMDSIEGKSQQLKSAWQELSTSFISSDLIKGMVDSLTSFVEFATDFDLLKIAVIGLTGALISMCAVNVQTFITGIIAKIPQMISYFNNAKIAISMTQGAFAKLGMALSVFNINPVVLGITALTAVVAGFAISSSKAKREAEALAEETRKLAEQNQNALSSIENLTARYKDAIDPLTGTAKSKEELIEIQRTLKETFGEEADKIDILNGKYEETVEKLNDLTVAKLKQNEVFLRDEYQRAKDEANEILEEDDGLTFRFDYEKTKEVVQKALGSLKDDFGDAINMEEYATGDFLKIDTTNIETAREALTRLLEILQNQGVERTDTTYQSILDTLQKVTTASDNLSKSQENLYNNLARTTVHTAMEEAGCKDLSEATDKQVESIKDYAKELEKTDPLLADFTRKLLEASNPDFTNFTKANAEAIAVYNTALEETKRAMTESSASVEKLDEAIKILTNGQMLSGEQINNLLNKHSSLRNSLEKTNKGYTLNKDALIALRTEIVNEENATASAQKNNVTNVINGAKARLTAYKQEVTAIKTLAEAQKALAGAKAEKVRLEKEEKDIVDTSLENLKNKRGWKNNATLDNFKLTALNQKQETQDKVITELETVVQGYETINELDKIIQEMEVTNTNSFNSATTPSSSAKKNGDNKKQSYISRELDVLIDDILSSTDKVEQAIEFSNEKLTNAQIKGDVETQKAIKNQIIDLIKQRRDEVAKQAEELRAEGEKMTKVLSDTGLFKGINLKDMTEKQLSDVSKKLEIAISTSTESEAESLELLKGKVDEFGQAIIRIYQNELPELSKAWWESQNESIDKMLESIDDAYNRADKLISNSIRDIELQQMLLESGSKEHMELEKKKYENVLKRQEEARQALKKIKEEDKNLESEMAQEYLNIWYDAEKEKREMIRAFAEQAMKDRQKEIESENKKLTDAQTALNKLLEDTIKLIKQEANDKKQSLQDEVDAYKELIDKKKDNLKLDKEARDDAKNLKKKQDAVAKIESEIAELQFDNSESALTKKLELEEQLAEAREELEDYQYEQSIEKQEEALDEEYKSFKELIDKQIKDIDDYLKKEGNLRADALKLIEENNKELYDKLIEWNRDYGSGVDEEITNAWDMAHSAMEEYNGGQMNVLDTLSKITSEMERLRDISESMKVEDFLDKEEGGMMGDIQDNPDTPSENHGDTISEEDAKKKEQTAQQKFLHNQAVKAKNEGNAGLLKWVQQERKKWGLDPISGAIIKGQEGTVPAEHWDKVKGKYNIYHKGGFVGGLESNEEFAKVLKGEYVATEAQMRGFIDKTLPNIVGVAQGSRELKFENLINLQVNGNLDSSVIPELENVIQKAVNGAIGKINDTMSSRGFRRTGMSIGI